MSATIADIVEIHSGYTSYVALDHELFDDSRNVERMARYRPVASHRQAFERLAGGLNPRDKRTYLLTGSYGTGKSHLCLMFANYLQTPANEKPMPEFLAHYREANPTAAEALAARRQKGRYLIALCEWGGRDDLDEIVLRAVDAALKRVGVHEELDTQYIQAARKIEEWAAFADAGDPRGRFLGEFEQALRQLSSPVTLAAFKQRLRSYSFDALEEFKRIYYELTAAHFTYDAGSLIHILTSTLRSRAFKERFLGILVLFDEFGDTMERGHLNPKMFQALAQLAAAPPSDCAQLIFLGTAHKTLTAYANPYSSEQFRTVSDRVEEVPLTPDGVEDIISAIVSPRKDSPLWQEHVAPRSAVFDSFQTDCTRLKLFNWLSGPKIRQNIIENIYPMHPMATFALLRLAQDIASNNRSVFTFFSGDLGNENAPGSYGEFISSTPIETNGKLNLYTADRLFQYFGDSLNADNQELRSTLRDLIKDYDNSRRELLRVAAESSSSRLQLGDDPLIERLMRLMLIYEIVQIPNRRENLEFGLYRTTKAERDELTNRLKVLADKGVLYFDKASQVYEFRKSRSIDLDRLIEEYKADPANLPQNIVATMEVLVPLEQRNERYLQANRYNVPYSEDKRLERRFVRPADLGAETNTPQGSRTYFETLEAELEKDARKSEYEGYALYAVCETADDISRARSYCARNQSERIIVAIPKAPVPMLDAIMEMRALEAIESGPEAQNFGTQDNAALHTRLYGDSNRPGAKDTLRSLRDKLMNSREITWLGKYAAPLPVDEQNPFDASDRVMEALYGEYRNKFPHDDFNKLRVKVERNRNPGLKEAVEELLSYTESVVIDREFSQARGDIRYLERCLLQNGVLRQVRVDGNKLRCEIETDPAKYERKMPALAAMVREVQDLPPNARLNVSEFLAKYRRPPYGQGAVALALSFACIRRLFGDSIRVKSEESTIGEMSLSEFESVLILQL